MSLRLNKKQLIAFVFLVLACMAGAAALYWLVLAPVKTENAEKQLTLKSEQQVLASLQSKQQANPELELGTIVNLLQKMPAKPLDEQFLLDFQMAESLSGSLIKDIENEKQTDRAGSSPTDSQSSATSQNHQSASPETTAAALPSGVKKLTYTLTVDSPNYKDMKTFLKTIENLSRITVIESIDFTKSGQTPANTSVDSSTATAESLEFTVTVSTFYYPELSNYTDYLPDIDVPPSSQKSDPISGNTSQAPASSQ